MTTIIKLKVSDNQEAFDAVVRHLAQQTERAVIENPDTGESCSYFVRDENGKVINMCAVGALIDQTLIDWDNDPMDWNAGMGVDDLFTEYDSEYDLREYEWTAEDPDGISLELLGCLQGVHDSYRPFDGGQLTGAGWGELYRIADRWDLDTKVLDEHCPMGRDVAITSY
jgi:hypothetical protein